MCIYSYNNILDEMWASEEEEEQPRDDQENDLNG